MSANDRRSLAEVQTLEPMLLMSASSVELPDASLDGAELASAIEAFSPIAIDLNRDDQIGTTGETTSKDKSSITEIGPTVKFDIDGDGTLDNIEWFDGSGDGILVDISKIKGSSLNGDALFGDDAGKYTHGYEKLAQRDTDGNNLLEGSELATLRLWLDDGDAKLESGELQKLSDHDIRAISVRLSDDTEGRFRSWAYTENDMRIMTEDVWFAASDAEQSEDDDNQPPVAIDDQTVTESGKSVVIDVLNNDSDPDGQVISVIGHTQAEHGTITLNANKTLTYTAPSDFTGVVYVQYSISNGTDAAIATVRIDVMPPNDAAPNIVPPADTSEEPIPPVVIGGGTDDADDVEFTDSDFDDDDFDDDASEKSGKSDKSNKSDKSDKSELRKAEEKAEKEAAEAAKELEKAAKKAAKEEEKAAEKAAKEAAELAKKAAKDEADD